LAVAVLYPSQLKIPVVAGGKYKTDFSAATPLFEPALSPFLNKAPAKRMQERLAALYAIQRTAPQQAVLYDCAEN